MTEQGYPLLRASEDLRAERLLTECWLAESGRWRRLAEADGASRGAESFLGACLDSRRVAPGELFVALAGEEVDGRRFVSEALATASVALTRDWTGGGDDPLLRAEPPRRGALLLSPDPVAALALLAGCWRRSLGVEVTGITGSNGKTTTKDFLAALLGAAGQTCATRGNLNNELGLPLTLLRLRNDHRFAVIEMGASAEGEIARLATLARPRIGIITNAGAAHLAQFGSIEGVIRGKGELLDSLPPDGLALLNADSPGFDTWAARAPCRVESYGAEAGEHRWRWSADPATAGGRVELAGQEWPVPLPGSHNGANLVAALLAARAHGLSDQTIRSGLANFAPSAHRGRLLQLAGWLVLDDAYNANPVSVVQATRALLDLADTGRTGAALGVMAELGPRSDDLHFQIGEQLCRLGLDHLVAVGQQAAPLAEGFHSAGGESFACDSKTEAVAWLRERLRPGDRLLVKGSRLAAMEEVLTVLQGDLPAAEKED